MTRLINRPALTRVAGNLALDLANTISWRGTDREVDHLSDAEAILAWARDSALVKSDFDLPRAMRTALMSDIHRLRGAIDHAGAAAASGRVPPRLALEVIHELAARSFAAAALTGCPARIDFAREHLIVGPPAWAAIELLRGNELDRLKQCPADDCRWLFIDRTKNGSRRWCEMATCGNRAKARLRR